MNEEHGESMSDKARELRASIFEVALGMAQKMSEVATSNELSAAEAQEHIDVDGIDWHIICTYDSEAGGVSIDGHPCSFPGLQKKIDDAGGQVTNEFAEEINEAQVLRQQLRFSWSMPVAWIERLAS